MGSVNTKVCTKCGVEKPHSDFSKYKSSPDGLRYWCKECFKVSHAAWYKENYKKVCDTATKRRQELKALVYAAYGNCCNCSGCFITDPLLLELAHVNDDGAEHRKLIGQGDDIYRWAIDNNFPREGKFALILLCALCHKHKDKGITCNWHEDHVSYKRV